jgi:hypothetical protein
MTSYSYSASGSIPASDNELASFTEEGHSQVMESLQNMDLNSASKQSIPTRRKKTVPKRVPKSIGKRVEFDKSDDVESTDSGVFKLPPLEQEASEPIEIVRPTTPEPKPQDEVFSFFKSSSPWNYFGNAFSSQSSYPPAHRDTDTESVKSTTSNDDKPKPSKSKKKSEVVDETDKDEEEAKKRQLLHQIGRYREKFSIKLRKQPTDRMSVKELEELKKQTISQITEKEGSRILKSFYCHGLTAIDQVSTTMGYDHLRGLGQVGTAIANDEENEILWEQLAIEFEEYLHVSPQKRLILLTAQILATTVRINSDPQFAANIAQEMGQAEERLRKEFAE